MTRPDGDDLSGAVHLKRSPSPLVLALSCLMSACATAPGPGEIPKAEADRIEVGSELFVRDVAPFPVLDEHGRPYDHPFLGGLLRPRIQFVDLSGDGVLDLFVQERAGRIMHFENVGDREDPHFVWRTDHFQELDVGEWFRFVDLDGDGRWDLMGEERFSHIRVFLNRGPAEDPRFELVPDTLRDVDGVPIFSDRQNIPSVTDIDCDGTLDLFLGRLEGTLTHYEEVDRATEHGLPRFRRVTDRFEGIEIVGAVGETPTLHGANSMAWHDVDGDGAQDLVWGDFFEPSVLFIENTASCPQYALQSPLRLIPTEGDPIATSGFNAPAFADITGDGREDLFIGVLGGAYNPARTAHANFHHYERTEGGRFRLATERFLTSVDVGSESVVAFADLDGDGAVDMVVGSKMDPEHLQTGRLFYFRNVGAGDDPAFQLTDTITLAESHHYAPAFADLWGDGTPGLALGTWNDGVQFYRHVGDGGEFRFEHVADLTVQLERGSHTVPALIDIDGNGLLDLFVGKSNGRISFFRNVGSPGDPRFELVDDEFAGIAVGRRSAPAFVDLDGDGRWDLLVGSEAGDVHVYRNVGTIEEAAFERQEGDTLELHRNATPTFVDLSGDGRKDLVAGGLAGGVVYFRRTIPEG